MSFCVGKPMSRTARNDVALRTYVESWVADRFGGSPGRDTESTVRHLVRKMAEAGLLNFDFGPRRARRRPGSMDLGATCVVREVLARRSCFADQIFMNQVCGTLAVCWFASAPVRDRVRPLVAQGKWLPVMVPPQAARRLSFRLDGSELVVDGETDWLPHAGVANACILFAAIDPHPTQALTAMIIECDVDGLTIPERACAVGAVPIARLAFKACRVPGGQLLGRVNQGHEILRACQRSMEPSNDASKLGLAQREIDRHARLAAATDLERLQSHVRAEANHVYRAARRLAMSRSSVPVRASTPSRAAFLLEQARGRVTSIHSQRKS
jgi:alkylation response protein AidB-like acyl-CoA dehydrogenase